MERWIVEKTGGRGGLLRLIGILLAGVLAFACTGACADAGRFTDPATGVGFPLPDGWKRDTEKSGEQFRFSPEDGRLVWVMFGVTDMWTEMNAEQFNISREEMDSYVPIEQVLTSLADASGAEEIKTRETVVIGDIEFARIVVGNTEYGFDFDVESLGGLKNGYLLFVQYYDLLGDEKGHDEFMYMLENLTFGNDAAQAVNGAQGAAAGWDFELRRGVRFGDTRETVLERETLTQILDDSRKIVYGDLQFTGTVVGIENTMASYYIDPERGVTEMLYRFSPSSSEDTTATYQMLLGMLKQKYGEPLAEGAPGKKLKGSIVQGIADYQEIAEWLIPDQSGSVKIELIRVDMVIFDTINVRFVWVDYTAFPNGVSESSPGGYDDYMDEL